MSPFAYLLKDDKSALENWRRPDHAFFAHALHLARSAQGTTHPNPAVGAVIVQDGMMVGEGYTQKYGGMHAEIHAIKNATRSLTGATLFVTLEPCCTFGKTPPCTDAIIEAGIKRVVFGCVDPNPRVFGRGQKKLSDNNIVVEMVNEPDLFREATAEIYPFRSWVLRERPYLMVKIATSRDNKVTAVLGSSTKVTGVKSDLLVHRLRRACDAVMVGANTARIDNPKLTARLPKLSKKQPTRIVMSSNLLLDERLFVFDKNVAPTIILTDETLAERGHAKIGLGKAIIIGCRTENGLVCLFDAMNKLAQFGFTNVLVEAGPKLLQSLMSSKLVDEIWWFRSNQYFGVFGLDVGMTMHELCAQGFVPQAKECLEKDELTIYCKPFTQP